jgi:hypothetical protein
MALNLLIKKDLEICEMLRYVSHVVGIPTASQVIVHGSDGALLLITRNSEAMNVQETFARIVD